MLSKTHLLYRPSGPRHLNSSYKIEGTCAICGSALLRLGRPAKTRLRGGGDDATDMVPPLETLPVSRKLGRTVGLHLVDAANAIWHARCPSKKERKLCQLSPGALGRAGLPASTGSRPLVRTWQMEGRDTHKSVAHRVTRLPSLRQCSGFWFSPRHSIKSSVDEETEEGELEGEMGSWEGVERELTGVVLAVLLEMERGRQHRCGCDTELVYVRDVLGHRVDLERLPARPDELVSAREEMSPAQPGRGALTDPAVSHSMSSSENWICCGGAVLGSGSVAKKPIGGRREWGCGCGLGWDGG